MQNTIHIIGVDHHGLTSEHRQLIDHCGLLVGGKRLLSLAGDCSIPRTEITPLQSAFATIKNELKENSIAVLASGDPLFFGIGRRLIAEFGSENIRIQPALSSVQEACAHFKIPWDDANLLTLHGRKQRHLPGLFLEAKKSIVLTDPANSPDILATGILHYLQAINANNLIKSCRVLVAENLGSEKERIFSGSLQEAAEHHFADLNIFCLLHEGKQGHSSFGLTEKEIHHSRGLITKNEVRAITLHKLQLPRNGVLWDVGGGSGSISIEAATIHPRMIIYTIEHKVEELENIKKNIRYHGCYNIIPVAGLAPKALLDLPAPDRIFIGGSGGNLAQIIQLAYERLPQNGRLVINGVIEKTITEAPFFLKEHGFTIEQSRIQITRTEQNGEETVLNPIHIFAGEKLST